VSSKNSKLLVILRCPTSAHADSKSASLQSAVTSLSVCLVEATDCSASQAGQLFCSSRVSVFAQLPRGPPNLACENF